MQQGDLYMIGWRPRRRSRQWQVSYCESLDQATKIARAHTKSDGGGWWWVYKMRLVVLPDGSACSVRHRQWSRRGAVHAA